MQVSRSPGGRNLRKTLLLRGKKNPNPTTLKGGGGGDINKAAWRNRNLSRSSPRSPPARAAAVLTARQEQALPRPAAPRPAVPRRPGPGAGPRGAAGLTAPRRRSSFPPTHTHTPRTSHFTRPPPLGTGPSGRVRSGGGPAPARAEEPQAAPPLVPVALPVSAGSARAAAAAASSSSSAASRGGVSPTTWRRRRGPPAKEEGGGGSRGRRAHGPRAPLGAGSAPGKWRGEGVG